MNKILQNETPNHHNLRQLGLSLAPIPITSPTPWFPNHSSNETTCITTSKVPVRAHNNTNSWAKKICHQSRPPTNIIRSSWILRAPIDTEQCTHTMICSFPPFQPLHSHQPAIDHSSLNNSIFSPNHNTSKSNPTTPTTIDATHKVNARKEAHL